MVIEIELDMDMDIVIGRHRNRDKVDIEKPEQGNQEEDMRDREMPEKEAECIYQPTLGINMHATRTETYHVRTHANYEVP